LPTATTVIASEAKQSRASRRKAGRWPWIAASLRSLQ
jgi:hypothetical protein